jgi:hypothetical protein
VLLSPVLPPLPPSWRYEYGHIAIFWLDTRNFAINFMDSDASFVSKRPGRQHCLNRTFDVFEDAGLNACRGGLTGAVVAGVSKTATAS